MACQVFHNSEQLVFFGSTQVYSSTAILRYLSQRFDVGNDGWNAKPQQAYRGVGGTSYMGIFQLNCQIGSQHIAHEVNGILPANDLDHVLQS